MNAIQIETAVNPLALWLALELRRARTAFDNSRKQQDARFKDEPKTGVRVNLTLKSASEICVTLADATIAKAGEFRSTPSQMLDAQIAVLAFTRNVANSAIPLAFFVSGETGLGGSAVTVAKQLSKQIYCDIEGAFALAREDTNTRASQLDDLLAILRDETTHNWEKERERINSEYFTKTRGQSHSHIKALAEAAELLTVNLLNRAFAVAVPVSDHAKMKRFVSSVFEPLAADIAEIAIGISGRTPQPENAQTAERWTCEAFKRIGNKISLWKLESEMTNSSQQKRQKTSATKSKMPVGRPKGAGAIPDSAHVAEMHTLILQTPGLTPRDAAKILERKAARPNTDPESTIRRLRNKYIEKHAAK